MKKNIIIALVFCLSLSSVKANENDVLSLDEAIAMYKGKEYIKKIASLIVEGVNTADESGFTALMYALDYGYIEIVKVLIKAGALVNIKDKSGNTALTHASSFGHIEIVKLLKGGRGYRIEN